MFAVVYATLILTTCLWVTLNPAPTHAVTTIPTKINFQGRLTDASGNIKPNGLYNIKFRLFDALSAGTNKFEEDYIMTGADNRVQVTNGLFNVQFGTLTSLASFDFSANPNLWLEVELPTPATATCNTNGCAVFTEGAMSPRQPLASAPYAFNADKLDGVDGSQFARNDAGNTFSGASNTFSAAGTALTVTNTASIGTLSVTSSASVGNGLSVSGAGTTSIVVGQKDARLILQNNTVTGNAGGEVVLGAVADTATGRYASIGTDILANSSGSANGSVYIATKSLTSDTTLTRRLIVLNTGEVGIGLTPTSGGDALQVSGSVNASVGLKVAGTTVCTSTGCTASAGSGSYIQNQNAGSQASSNFNISGNGTIGNALTVSGGGADITLNGATSNYINYGAIGFGAPTFTSRSVGTKLVLYNALAGASADYAIGIDASILWNSVPTTSEFFKWYGGTSQAALLTGTGNLTLGTGTGTLTSGLINGQTISSTANLTGTLAVGSTSTFAGLGTFNGGLTSNLTSGATSGTLVSGQHNITGNPSSASTTNYYANYNQANYTGTAATTGNLVGSFGFAAQQGGSGGNVAGAYGLYGEAYNSGAGTIGAAVGTLGIVTNGAATTGNIATATALQASVNNISTSGANFATAYGLSVTQPAASATGTIGTAYGVNIAAQKVTGVTTGYGLYQAGSSDSNVFAGKLSLQGDVGTGGLSGIQSQGGNFNLAPNSGFEVKANPTGVYPDGWTGFDSAGNGTATTTWASDAQSDGLRAMKSAITGTTSYSEFTTTSFIPVQPSTSYMHSVDIKNDATANSCSTSLYVRIDWYSSVQALITSTDTYANAATTTSWAAYSGTATSPANATFAKIEYYNFQIPTNPNGCTRWFDNAVFRPVGYSGAVSFGLNTGNVGIGTTGATSKLTVYDASNSIEGQRIRLGVAANVDYTIGRNPATGNLDFIGTQTGAIGYTFNGGNVGIGAAGAYKLDVVGDINTSTTFRVGGTSGSTTTCSGGQFLQNQVVTGGITTGGTCATASGGSGVTTVGALNGGTANATGATINTSTIFLQSASGSFAGLVDTTTQTFAGAKTFSGKLTVGAALGGTALSPTFVTSSGALSSTANSELILGSFGFTGTNTISLGVSAVRTAAGSDWTTTAIGLGLNVDNTLRAGAALWLNANGNVGIGNSTPGNKLTVGTQNGQSSANISARAGNANAFEWGHSNTAGYGSTLGYNASNGLPFLCFSCEAGTSTANSFMTRGNPGTVIQGTINGGLQIGAVTGANADNQTLTSRLAIDGSGNINIGGGLSGRRLDVYNSANNGDGLAIGQDTDNTQTIQAYIDNQWSNRVTYASGCCNVLKLQPDVGSVQIGSSTNPTSGLNLYGTLNGNVVVDNQTLGTTTTITEATPALAYQFTNTFTGGSVPTITFNITGLPNVDGTLAFIVSSSTKVSGPAGSAVTVQINGATISTVNSCICSAAQTISENYTVIRTNGVWRIVGYGNTQGATNNTTFDTADYAEWIPYSGADKPQSGDLLTVGDTDNSVKRTSAPYDHSMLGVVSTSPYQTASKDDGHSVILALTGRVPVNVTLENGPIKAGDKLTSSSTPGHAMKATGSGEIIGTALSSYDGTQPVAQVMVQLHAGYDSPNGDLQGGQSTPSDIATTGNATVGKDLNVGGTTTTKNLVVSGSANVGGDLTVTGHTLVGSLTVSGDIEAKGNLHVDGAITAGSLTVAGPTKLQDLEVGGHFITSGTVPIGAPLSAAGFSAAVNINGTDTAGTITITTGTTGIGAGELAKLTFAKAFGAIPRIIISGQDDLSLGARIFPSNKTPADFTLKTAQSLPPNTTYTFDYFIAQ